MKRWVPFAIAIFMLTPFALWAGFAFSGLEGTTGWRQTGVGAVLFAASLPLAGLFWIQNLRQLGDSMGAPSRFRLAARLAAVLPAAILVIGAVGAAWLVMAGAGPAQALLATLGTLAMAGFGWLVARAPVEPGQPPAAATPDPAAEDAAARHALLFLLNIAMALTLLAYLWTPWVLLWAVAAAVPVAFVLIMALAWWAAETAPGRPAAAAPPGAPANDAAAAARAA
ncbi:MAG: hypothetical protein MUC64_02790 [Rubritepida sp.]|jgi:hypothetical protein|nr:hypothetical protein [Rubritepida sp.]